MQFNLNPSCLQGRSHSGKYYKQSEVTMAQLTQNSHTHPTNPIHFLLLSGFSKEINQTSHWGLL